jgi:glycosyltransferase involved in cell wall biosynthesis
MQPSSTDVVCLSHLRWDFVFRRPNHLMSRSANDHVFPSSVDIDHFGRARRSRVDPFDQVSLPHPRIGFFGVLDERLDRDLLRQAAALRPRWQWILVGPVVKIAPESLPRAANIHYRGMRPYDGLPDYVAHWDLTMMPFARNAATRFISPTKTLEYLAAGKPVISIGCGSIAAA